MEENKPLETDSNVEETKVETTEEGRKDVGTKEEKATLSLDDLNTLAGREGDNAFKSVEDFNKHYGNLKGFVGDPEAIKARKEQEKVETTDALQEVRKLREELAEKSFVASNPDAKNNLDIIKAYAAANSLGLSEAWEKISGNFASGNSLKTNQRINPVNSTDRAKLVEQAKSGDANAQERLVMETFFPEK